MKQIFFILLILTLSGTGFGEIPLVPNPEIVAIGELEEPIPIKTLIRASLIASGVPAYNLDDYTRRFLDITHQAVTVATGHPLIDGEALLQWMHRRYLSQYVESQTRMDTLLESGQFNCVSSAVMYLILSRAIGIKVLGVSTKDHAFCRLPEVGDGIDVETTNSYGFNPGSRREVLDLIEGQTGFAYVPPGHYEYRQDIGEKELIALIYQNRIANLQSQGDWQPITDLALDRWTLANTSLAREEFIMSLNNAAADADRHKRGRDILVVLNDAASLLGDNHGLEKTALTLFGNSFARYWNANQLDDALKLIDDPEATHLIPSSFLEEKRREIKIRNLDNTIQRSDFAGAVHAVDAALTDGIISPQRWMELARYLWFNEAQKRSSGRRWIEGLRLLRDAPLTLKSNPEWQQVIQSYENNVAVTYHNRFVKVSRNREWNEAREIITDGLSVLPGNTTLLSDLEDLNLME